MAKDNKYYEEKLISHSSLSYFEESPIHFRKYIDGELEEPEQRKYQELGTIIHMYFLERELFDKKYEFYDYTIPSSQQQKDFCEKIAKYKRPTDQKLIESYKEFYVTKAKSEEKILSEAKELKSKNKEYIKYLRDKLDDKEVLNKNMKELLTTLEQNVKDHIKAYELLYDKDEDLLRSDYESHNEFSIYWTDPGSNLKCKSLIDRLVIDHKSKKIRLIDIKTSFSFKDTKDKIKEYNYNRQMSFYTYAILDYLKSKGIDNKDYDLEVYIIMLKTKHTHEVKVVKLSDGLLNEGNMSIRDLFTKMNWHYENNKWDHDREYYINDGYLLI